MAHTNRQTDKQADGHCNSKTESAQSPESVKSWMHKQLGVTRSPLLIKGEFQIDLIMLFGEQNVNRVSLFMSRDLVVSHVHEFFSST